MRPLPILLTVALLSSVACHPRPIIDTVTGKRYEATTATNGGYTIQVPEGTYRLEVQLREGERVSKQPDQTQVNKSDLDSGRDFVITAARS